MGNTATENESGWIRPMTAAELRDPVLGQAAKEFLMVLAGGAVVLALLASRGKEMGVITIGLGFVYLFLLAKWAMKLLAATVSTFGSPRADTMTVIRRGQIAPTYMLHDAWHISFIAVDENRRLIAINGKVVSFDDIRKIGWSTHGDQHALEFILRTGTKPSINLAMRDEGIMRQNYERLANTLELA